MANAPGPRVDNIQGNIFGGFNKDFQSLSFLQFTDRDAGRAWVATMAKELATSAEVIAFNDLFKRLTARRGGELGLLKVTWANLAFTHSGMEALGVSSAELGHVFAEAGFARFRRATETPFNLVLEARK